VVRVEVAGTTGGITAVHVVARPGSDPQRVTRDTRSVALASLGLALAEECVTVSTAAEPSPAPRPRRRSSPDRPAVVAVTTETDHLRSLVRVTLAAGSDVVVGFAEGSVASSARHRLVAVATVDALRQLTPAAECIDVAHAELVRIGAHDVAVVTLVFVVPPSEELVSGSAAVHPHQEEADAFARAVCDATNRRLAYLFSS